MLMQASNGGVDLELCVHPIRCTAMRGIIIFVVIAALAGCDRSIGETGSNASADAQQLGVITAEDHRRESPVAPGAGKPGPATAIVAATQSSPVQH